MPGPVLEHPFLWKHMAASGQVLGCRGALHTITINRPDATAGATITVYDSLTGTGSILAIISVDKAIYVVPTTLIYDCELTTGLYLLFADGLTTADVTVSYR